MLDLLAHLAKLCDDGDHGNLFGIVRLEKRHFFVELGLGAGPTWFVVELSETFTDLLLELLLLYEEVIDEREELD